MKSKFSCGSALLLVFVISFIMSLAAIRCWHVSSLMLDVQCQRELFYRRFYMTNRILNAGIDLACKKFDTFLKLEQATDIDVNFCLTEAELEAKNSARFTVSSFVKKTKNSAKLKSKNNTERLLLSASLLNSNILSNPETVCNLKCLLERNRDGKLNVETKFVVTHFTLSASL